MTSLDTLRECYERRDDAAREWKSAGGSVVGYLCDHVPVELIAAAGMLPYRLSAEPTSGSSTLGQYVVPFVQQPLPTPGFVASMEHRVLSGWFDFVDYLIIPNGRKSIQAFYRDFLTAKSAYTDLRLPELYYFDKAMTPTFAASEFDRKQVFRLREALEVWSGTTIRDEVLRAVIEEENEGRRLIAAVARARSATPPTISGVDALHVIATRYFMARREHNELLRGFLAESAANAGRPGPRIFVGGSPHDDDALYRVIEGCGATVVSEDHCWGTRCAELVVEETVDPIEALASRYHAASACSIRFPISSTTAACVGRAQDARPDAAIFYVYESDAAQQWQVPDQIRSLRAAEIPVLYLSNQRYGANLADAGHSIDKFLAGIR